MGKYVTKFEIAQNIQVKVKQFCGWIWDYILNKSLTENDAVFYKILPQKN